MIQILKTFAMGAFAVAMMVSCENTEFVDNGTDPGKNGKKQIVTFEMALKNVPQQKVVRGQASDYADASKLTVLAYKKIDESRYQFFDMVDRKSDSQFADGNKWSNPSFSLPIGTYRFVAFYNIGGGLEMSKAEGPETWENILAGIMLTNSGTSLDVNEVFASTDASMTDVVLAEQQEDNNEVIVPLSLDRVNTRIDVMVKKVYKNEDGTEREQGFKDGNSIFGVGTTTLNGVTTSAATASSWTWGGKDDVTEVLSFEDDNSYVYVGTKTPGSDVKSEKPYVSDNNTDNILVEKMVRGTGFYRGCYILPFKTAESPKTIDKVEITFYPTAEVSEELSVFRTLVANNVKAEKNKVTLLTFKLQATTSGDGDDKENLFNPNVKYVVTIEQQWNGVNQEPDIEI